MEIRAAFFRAAKLLGMFSLINALRKTGLILLCYHGFSIRDEHCFRPSLFMTPQSFERRLLWLLDRGYKVISLAEGLKFLDEGDFGARRVVITIDDGFFSVGQIAWPLLRKYGFPATLYVTTYYSTHQNPVFRLAIQYFLWRTAKSEVWLDGLSPAVKVSGRVAVHEPQMDAVIWALIDWAEASLSESQRWALATTLADRLDVDPEELQSSRRLSLLTPNELAELARDGLDIQLHTHRHRLSENEPEIMQEIKENREVLEPIAGGALSHFCYPSGIWSERHWKTLKALGIRSAATCMPGFNYENTPRLALRRFLDSERLTQLDFEAEIMGIKTAIREMRRGGRKDTFTY